MTDLTLFDIVPVTRHWCCDRGHTNPICDTHGWGVLWASCPQCPTSDQGPYRINVYERAASANCTERGMT